MINEKKENKNKNTTKSKLTLSNFCSEWPSAKTSRDAERKRVDLSVKNLFFLGFMECQKQTKRTQFQLQEAKN